MDMAMIRHHLAMAENHVLQCERHLGSQHAVIARLESNGSDLVEARRLLKLLHETQELHVNYRNRLVQALAELRR